MAAARTTKKVQSKGKVSSGVKAKVTPSAPKKEAPKPNKVPESTSKRKNTSSDVDAAVDEIMETIDEQEYAGSDVSQSETVEYYKGIITICQERIATIEGEMEEADEDEDAAPPDDKSDEPLDLGDDDGDAD